MSLTKQDMLTIQGIVAQSVRETVNGKIDSISRKLDAYILEDNAWKADAQPAIDNMKTIRVSVRVIFSVLAVVGSVTAFFANLGPILVFIRKL